MGARVERRRGAMKDRTQQRESLRRQWELVEFLHGAKRGKTVGQIMDALCASRSSVYRDLALLEAAGVPLAKERVNGETRRVMVGEPLSMLRTPRRQTALALACAALSGLSGTRLYRELVRLRDERVPPEAPVAVDKPQALPPAIVEAVERALAQHRVLVITYRGVKDPEPRERRVCPLVLRVSKGQLYLDANELEDDAPRVFKIARIERAQIGEAFDPRGRTPASHAHAVSTWSGEPVAVAVRITPEGARFVHEFPLVQDQDVVPANDGSVVVRATVAGTEEVVKWALSWGRKAEVLEPMELRERVATELREALGAYEGNQNRGVPEQGVSRIVRQRGARVGVG
jgi:predicted DNA-binding transcriptional regulator YafY